MCGELQLRLLAGVSFQCLKQQQQHAEVLRLPAMLTGHWLHQVVSDGLRRCSAVLQQYELDAV